MQYITSKEIEELGFTIQRGLVGVEVGVANLELRMNERTAELAKQTDAIIKLTAAILSLGKEDDENEQCGESVTANQPNRRATGHPEARSVTHPMTNDQHKRLRAGYEDDYDDNAAWARDMRTNQLMEESATGDEV
tara:strand:+ start:1039 stop:1446 length:408 start_codon:yes stop_codon:yes gene_type:complete